MAYLVPLAHAGVSGVCIAAVFYLTRLLKSLPNNASLSMHTTVRLYIVVVLLMAVILAASSWQSTKSSELAASRQLNEQYRLRLTSLATTIDGKVQYEMGEVTSGRQPLPALSVYIKQLNETIQKAKEEGLLKVPNVNQRF